MQMKMLGKLIAPLILLFAAPACAQPAPAPATVQDADPALWVVKDKDTTIYLFGTIHVLRPGLSWFDDGVKKAFDASKEVVLEIKAPDSAEMARLLLAVGIARDGIPLEKRLPEEKRAAYTKALTDLGENASIYSRFDPWLAASQITFLSLKKLGYDRANGPEETITKAAAATGKQVSGLETPAEQLGYFHALPMPIQVKFLTDSLDELPKLNESISHMIDGWSKGDPVSVAKLLNDDTAGSPELKKILVVDRNKRWAGWINERMKQPGVVFIAVGAGHLAGADSVQEQLKPYRLKARRVKY